MQQPKPGKRCPYLPPFCGRAAKTKLASRKKLLTSQDVNVHLPTKRKSGHLVKYGGLEVSEAKRLKGFADDTSQVAYSKLDASDVNQIGILSYLRKSVIQRENSLTNIQIAMSSGSR